MSAENFAILKNKENLSHAYLFRGNYNSVENNFAKSLANLNINIKKPGHFVINGGTFTVEDARNIVSWHNLGANSEDDFTVAIIAPDVFKKDAQQMLLKVLEETREKYLIFIFLSTGIDVLDTIISRVQIHNLDLVENLEIVKFIKSSIIIKLEKVSKDTKGMESSEIREYTQNLTNELISVLSNDVLKNKDILLKLNTVQNSLSNSYIAPKFILDYIVTIL